MPAKPGIGPSAAMMDWKHETAPLLVRDFSFLTWFLPLARGGLTEILGPWIRPGYVPSVVLSVHIDNSLHSDCEYMSTSSYTCEDLSMIAVE